ncbi:hypothetical protein [Streptomyces hokutonensis]|uniref:hypothetical protein n=1 Tax=Streptomyces hokutonensis TaxID=1306990 RepID=UPI00039FFB99|nr:hypothetical protein [Streptomyces hokutonensis]
MTGIAGRPAVCASGVMVGSLSAAGRGDVRPPSAARGVTTRPAPAARRFTARPLPATTPVTGVAS